VKCEENKRNGIAISIRFMLAANGLRLKIEDQ